MRDITGMKQERGRVRQRVDARHGFLSSRRHVFVCFLVESDMTVADLHKPQVGLRGMRPMRERLASADASSQAYQQACAGPRHALQEAAPVDAVVFVVMKNEAAHWDCLSPVQTQRRVKLFPRNSRRSG